MSINTGMLTTSGSANIHYQASLPYYENLLWEIHFLTILHW